MSRILKLLFPNRHYHTWIDTPIVKAVNIGGLPEWCTTQLCECGEMNWRYEKININEILDALNQIGRRDNV
jgi:hypothetical protein